MENQELNKSNAQNKVENGDQIEGNLEEYLMNLMKEKELLACQGKYLEADIIRKKINDIKNNTIIRNKRELENRQINEMKQLEDNFNAEIKAINDYWNNEFLNFQNHYTSLTNNMEEKHKKEILNLKDFIEEKYNKNFKFSKEYLDLKTSELNLVKQERYVEAHQIKQRCDFLEKTEIEKHMKMKEENFELKSENLIKQQNLEKSALAQKMNSEFDEMNKIKQIELDKIVTKYKNKKFELESKQGKEINLHENENMLKANLFNNNLVNFTNYDNMMSINKSMSKTNYNKINSISDTKLKESNPMSKRSFDIKPNNLGGFSDKRKSSGKSNGTSQSISGNGKSLVSTNKSIKMFNTNGVGQSQNKDKPGFVRNLQYSSSSQN